jgi:pimeloyl-ACP methyl ester carboxylesterase
MAWARRAFSEKPDGSRLERTYDLRIAQGFASLSPDNPLPPVWELFDKLAGIPLMLVHGRLSDLLSPQGVQDMQLRRPDIDLVEVPDQGHAPLLADAPTIDRIKAFCARCDEAEHSAP